MENWKFFYLLCKYFFFLQTKCRQFYQVTCYVSISSSCKQNVANLIKIETFVILFQILFFTTLHMVRITEETCLPSFK